MTCTASRGFNITFFFFPVDISFVLWVSTWKWANQTEVQITKTNKHIWTTNNWEVHRNNIARLFRSNSEFYLQRLKGSISKFDITRDAPTKTKLDLRKLFCLHAWHLQHKHTRLFFFLSRTGTQWTWSGHIPSLGEVVLWPGQGTRFHPCPASLHSLGTRRLAAPSLLPPGIPQASWWLPSSPSSPISSSQVDHTLSANGEIHNGYHMIFFFKRNLK